jgi:SAM-dependent methyltransferase
MLASTAQYDGLAVGPGDGDCLDLGCGTGRYLAAIESTGRTVVGVDRSADQLRLARSRFAQPVPVTLAIVGRRP